MSSIAAVGKVNTLKILRQTEDGYFLDGQNLGEIFLAKRFAKDINASEDSSVTVFIAYDSDDRLMATTEKPKVQVGEFSLLQVIATQAIGTFLDWGLAKDLFLPFAEQLYDLRPGQEIIVYVYLDKSQRISASMRLDKHLKKIDLRNPIFKIEQNVELFICGKTDLGYKAIVNGTHLGILFENEVFQSLYYGQKLPGFIKKIRDDGKIDLCLSKTGHRAAEDISPLIINLLEKNDCFLSINEKTPPETIYQMFGVSKKKYKMVLGSLYKKKLITITEDGIFLVKPPIN